MNLRHAIELLFRNTSYVRKLPAKYGGVRCVVSPEGGLRYLGRIGDVDPLLLEMARKFVRKNDVVWDIGANLGLFTAAASYFAGPEGQVVLLEPDNWLVGLLRRTASLRDRDRQSPIEVIPCAVSSGESLAEFCIAERSRCSNALAGTGRSQMGGVRETITVPTVSLDWLLERRKPPALVKIDVEGSESEVLSGATRLLSAARPIVIVEVAPDDTNGIMEMTARLKGAHYQLFDGQAASWLEQPVPTVCWATIAIPEERVQSTRSQFLNA
jgi:FkbM family methyltransferase